ncbi:hypothetical protein [Vibrio alginolyticus]|uniref:hypothetical protein n=1 Tax=Vibrio alginolyticus TaxID=663 RepID=UPI00215CB9F5|nr:hypothetical protein [Vibrio alginolyticus]MCR9352123.1 hypothetical protein [Vibrio alginolyticus]MCR9362558.1 hypothetical protein [Vibrio alginolyticus]
MKKNAMIIALLSAGLMSSVATAKPASSVLEWRGFVDGSFDGSDIALTGQGGGDIQKGVLTIAKDGSISTDRAIVVEAHEVDESGAVQDLFGGDVAWNISATSVSHPAYDAKDITISMNGTTIEPGTPVKTTAGNHIVGFAASGLPTDADKLTPGDVVSITTLVLAEQDVTSTP